MSIFKVLDQLEESIRGSFHIPFTGLAFLVDTDRIMAILEKVKASLPEELKQAQFITQENQRIIRESQEKAEALFKTAEEKSRNLLDEAKEKGEKIVLEAEERARMIQKEAEQQTEAILKSAQDQALRKVSESEIVRLAHEQASRLIQQSEQASLKTKEAVEQYASDVLAKLEQELQRLVSVVKKGKERLEESRHEILPLSAESDDHFKEISVE